jgi:hypothetical protein
MSKRHSSKKKASPAHIQGIPATKERQRQNGGVIVEAIHERNGDRIYIRRHRAKFASILDAYLWHERISEAEHDAGEKFGREYSRSVLKIKTNDTGAHGDFEDPFISAINGNHLLRKAFDALSPTELEIIISVCVYNEHAGNTRKINFLSASLQSLAKCWKML